MREEGNHGKFKPNSHRSRFEEAFRAHNKDDCHS